MCKKYFIFIFIVILILILDQGTKYIVHTQFELGESVVIINDILNITYAKNYGAAFGILSNSPETFRKIFFLLFPLGALAFILIMLRKISAQDKLQVLALSAIAGGALGNWAGRLKHGFVVDFIDFHFKRYFTYPAFNISDCAIVIGALLMVLAIIRDKNHKNIKGVKS